MGSVPCRCLQVVSEVKLKDLSTHAYRSEANIRSAISGMDIQGTGDYTSFMRKSAKKTQFCESGRRRQAVCGDQKKITLGKRPLNSCTISGPNITQDKIAMIA